MTAWLSSLVPCRAETGHERVLTAEEEAMLESGGDPFAAYRTGDPVRDAEFSPVTEFGFIAQEVEAVVGLTDIVTPGSETVLKKVDYRGIGVLAVGAIKALSARMEALERAMDASK